MLFMHPLAIFISNALELKLEFVRKKSYAMAVQYFNIYRSIHPFVHHIFKN